MNEHSTSTSSSKKKEEKKHYLNKDYLLYISKVLGKGGFGQLFEGKNIKENTHIAIKCEEQGENSHLYIEYSILKELEGAAGFPKVYKLIKGHRHNYLVMELLGKSIEKLFSDRNRKFTMKTVCQIAYQMVERIQFIHSKGYIHRDIKPGNFLIGKEDKENLIYAIDFGLSKKYLDKNKNHIPFKEGKGLTGTARYVSLFTHKGYEQSRRDDIECIAYNLIFLAKGKLPWQGVKTKNKKEKHKKIFELKKGIDPEDLCKHLPEEFPTLLKYARKLDFEEEPDYKNILIMFQNLIENLDKKMDMVFDWQINSEDEDEKDSDDTRNRITENKSI